MTLVMAMKSPGFGRSALLMSQLNDTQTSFSATKPCPFRYRDKEYCCASEALQAYIDAYEGKSAQRKITDDAIRELLTPSILESPHDRSDFGSQNERLKQEIANDKLAQMRHDMESSYHRLLVQEQKRRQVNQAMAETLCVLSQLALDNLSSLPDSPPTVASEIESETTDMLLNAKPYTSPRHGHVYSYHTKTRSASMSRADSLSRADASLRRSDLESKNSLKLSLHSGDVTRSQTVSTGGHNHVDSSLLKSHYARPTLSNSLKHEKANRTDNSKSRNHSLRWSPNLKGAKTSTPQIPSSRVHANPDTLSHSESRGRLSRQVRRPGVSFHSTASDISTRGRPPPSWVNDVDGRNTPSWVSDVDASDTNSVNSGVSHTTPSWINTDASDTSSAINGDRVNTRMINKDKRLSSSSLESRTDGAPRTSHKYELFPPAGLPRSSSYEDLAISQKSRSRVPVTDYKTKLSTVKYNQLTRDEKEDSILAHVNQLLDSSTCSANDEFVGKSVTFSPDTDAVLDGDRSWEKPLTSFKSPVYLREAATANRHGQKHELHKDGLTRDKVDNNSPRLTGQEQPGSMEALKNMLFTMQGVASGTGDDGGVLPSHNNGVLPSKQHQGEASELFNVLEPQTKQMMDDSFIMNQGGESLQRALVHLSRLKTLVQSDPTSQLAQSE